jgi:hypothetical protein
MLEFDSTVLMVLALSESELDFEEEPIWKSREALLAIL